jgi:hypothetical protein
VEQQAASWPLHQADVIFRFQMIVQQMYTVHNTQPMAAVSDHPLSEETLPRSMSHGIHHSKISPLLSELICKHCKQQKKKYNSTSLRDFFVNRNWD